MSAIQAMQNLLEAEKQKQEADLRDLSIVRDLLKSIDRKIDEKFSEIDPKSEYRLLSIKDVESLIPFKSKWIDERSADGSFPRPKMIGSKKIWYLKDVERWIQENMGETEH